MAKPKSKPYRAAGNHQGELVFGHIHQTGGVSSTMLRNGQVANHYISMDIKGPENGQHLKGGTTIVSPGSFQVKAGDNNLQDDIPGIFLESSTGDIVNHAPSGRVRIIGQDVDIIAEGNGAEQTSGNVLIKAQENFHVNAKNIKESASESCMMVSEKTTEIVGKAALNQYGGVIEALDSSVGDIGFGDLVGLFDLSNITSLSTFGDLVKQGATQPFENRAKAYAGGLNIFPGL